MAKAAAVRSPTATSTPRPTIVFDVNVPLLDVETNAPASNGARWPIGLGANVGLVTLLLSRPEK